MARTSTVLISGVLRLPEIANLPSPIPNFGQIYVKTDNQPYYLDENGVETPLLGGGGGAPTNATYVTLSLNGTLTNERVLTGTANQVILADGGANSTITLSLPQDIATTSTVHFAELDLGTAASATGILKFNGLTSGVITITASAIAGTYTLTLPPDDGTLGQVLTTDGLGNLTWTSGAPAATITVTDESADTTCFPIFTTAAVGVLAPKSNAGLTFNSASSLLTATALASSSSITVGVNGATGGTILLNGSTSGTITLQPAAAAGTYTLTLPTDDGTVGQVLRTDGSGVLSWVNVTSTAAGADKNVQFNDGGTNFGGDNDFEWDKIAKVLYVNGKLTVTGIIDPTQVLLTGADKRFGATDAGAVYLAPFTDAVAGVQIRRADNLTSVLSVDTLNSRVGIGTATPVVSSILDLTSTTKGFLMPRMSTVARDAIATPATSLFIFNTDDNAFNFYDGVAWSPIVGAVTIPKQSVDLATTPADGNLTLSGEQTIDSVLTSTSRVLVKEQTLPEENGVYNTAAGAWTRATDYDADAEVVAGTFFAVIAGTVNQNTIWMQVTPAPTINVDPLVFTQIGSGFAPIPTLITVTNEAADTTCFPSFFTAATGNLGPKTNAGLIFNSATSLLTSTILASTTSITAGVNGGTSGSILLNGSTSGTITITTAAAAGTYQLTLPTDDGTVGQVLTTDGSGVLSWSTVAAGVPTLITVADESADTTCFPAFFTAATGNLGPKTNAGLIFDAATATFGATFIAPITSLILNENVDIVLDASLSADGKYCGTTEAGSLGETVAFGQIVVFDSAASQWYKADPNAATSAVGDCRGKVGMCVVAGNVNDPTVILLMGKIRADAAFPSMTINRQMFISETPGDIVQAFPVTSGCIVRALGSANTANELYFNPSTDWVSNT